MLGRGGGFRGRSTKARNIVLNWKDLLAEVSALVFPVVSAATIPWLLPFAALVVWNRIRFVLSIDLTERHGIVLYALWKNRDLDNKINPERLLNVVDLELTGHARAGGVPSPVEKGNAAFRMAPSIA